ncbi:MAG: Hsp20/alpha crystallin family protein [Planctomycetes bacterium]|nr:Hsp20/alpha crystallin family protein [Planctomycetota bacterium]MCH9727306.1 Hsp20/alpha crystallin family protein [Planctomycetota bacterium]MCH9779164.1 Hsp20/alpha crystallin family protein [Planctomycetota bacterium]MCH9792256.1 Hsp20/alpha crystallin family protein [Planctomycetota bacterium]MDF1744483.1 Hsp20/alpha crystallin family protein [Gimesia sp.]
MTVAQAVKGTVARPDQSLVKSGPFGSRAPFWVLRNEMDNLLSHFSGDGGLTHAFDAVLDMSETDHEIEVRMDVPGIQPEEIEVEVTGNTLIITGERKEEKEEKGRTYHRIERTSGSFSRSMTLPCEVDRDQVQALCDNGVLTITLPKSNLSKAHKITVKPKF